MARSERGAQGRCSLLTLFTSLLTLLTLMLGHLVPGHLVLGHLVPGHLVPGQLLLGCPMRGSRLRLWCLAQALAQRLTQVSSQTLIHSLSKLQGKTSGSWRTTSLRRWPS